MDGAAGAGRAEDFESDRRKNMKKGWIIGLVAVALIALSVYNGIVGADERCNEAWANVETVLQRRFDLIPNLVETVKGYAKHEEAVFTEVAELRSQWAKAQTPDEKMEAASGIERAFGRLMRIQESYPELKANQNFIALQDELAGTENRVATERTRYNEAVKQYNVKIRKIPGVWFAGFMGMEPRKAFEAQGGAENAPKVEF